MPRYGDDIIEEVRQRSDIVDIVSGYVRLTRRGSNYFGLCPFHNEKSPSFSVTPSKQMYYCFGCGAGGNVFNFLMQYENLTFGEAVEQLADRANIALPKIEYSRENKEKADRRKQLLDINKAAAGYYFYQLRRENGKQAWNYLSGRGLSPETIQSFGLGYSDKFGNGLYQYLKSKEYSDELLRDAGLFNHDEKNGMYDKFWNRVIFPIMDVNSRVIGFGGRVMGDGKPKYLNSPETEIFDKSRNLYGLNIARSSRQPRLILCEGYMDVITMHQAGFHNAVASLGTSLTSGHASLLKRYTNEVLLIYDSDDAGVRAALRAIPILKDAGLNARVVDLKPYKDPDEFLKNMGAEAFTERLEHAMDSFLFRVLKAQDGLSMQDPQGQNQFFDICAEYLLEFEDELERNLYIDAIVREYGRSGISAADLRKRVSLKAMKGTGREQRMVRRAAENETRKIKQDNASDSAQKLMLTWMVSYPEILPEVCRLLKSSDFVNPLYREVAEKLFGQIEAGEMNPARILTEFADDERQKEVASLFHANLTIQSDEEFNHAFAEALFKIKSDSIKEHQDLSDIKELKNYIEDKKNLEQLKKKRFHFTIMDTKE